MLAVSGAFPLTSDQPPVAVVTPKALTALMPGWDRISNLRLSDGTASGRSPGFEAGVELASSSGLRLPALRNPFAIAGPPPAFEANVLEIERRFGAILARIELARAQQEMRRGSSAEAGAPASPAAKSADSALVTTQQAERVREMGQIIRPEAWRLHAAELSKSTGVPPINGAQYSATTSPAEPRDAALPDPVTTE